MSKSRKSLRVVAAAVVVAFAGTAASAAFADDRHDWHRDRHVEHRDWHHGPDFGLSIQPPVVYEQPPAVYYEPPPPPPVVGFGLDFRIR